jgi:hypothetical protein
MIRGPSAFGSICLAQGLPEPVPEWRFDEVRRWRFDWAWPDHKVALEVEGGVFTRGRHTRGAGFLGDMEKYNRAAVLGWRVLRTTPEDMASGQVFGMLMEIFA